MEDVNIMDTAALTDEKLTNSRTVVSVSRWRTEEEDNSVNKIVINIKTEECIEEDFENEDKHSSDSDVLENKITKKTRNSVLKSQKPREKKTYECEFCNEGKFQTKQKLQHHMKTVHINVKPYKCNHCDYTTSNTGHMKIHNRAVHLKLKPFRCIHCDYSCYRGGDIKKHNESVHQKLKPFKCELCDYTSSESGHMKRHNKSVHMKLKPFKCEHCDYSSAEKAKLNRHTKAVHKDLNSIDCETTNWPNHLLDFEVNNESVANKTAKIKAKKLSTIYSQDKIASFIVTVRDKHPEISDSKLADMIVAYVDECYTAHLQIDDFLKDKYVTEVNHPIKCNKTLFQLSIVRDHCKEECQRLIIQIRDRQLPSGLNDEITLDSLLALQLPSDESFWGSENATVSSVLLAAVEAMFVKEFDQEDDPKKMSMPGAATFFPISSFEFPDEIVANYPFATKNGILLFGDYELSEPLSLFGSEDCSSAVGKPTNLTDERV